MEAMQKLLINATITNTKDVIKAVTVAKKNMSKPMQNEYIPKEVEAEWYDWWVSTPYFHCDPSKGKPYVMLIPPPNVTGSLHVGHAMFVTIQDTICRYKRMCGYQVCWVPGTDHAGIATQSVVEKQLLKLEPPIRRIDLGREKFLEKVWDWKHKYGNQILEQFKRLSASVDWRRTFFTMDEPRSLAVTEAFCRLYDKGYIYRSSKMVNWCCYLRTAISDIEVESKKIDKPTKIKIPGCEKPVEFGYLTHFAYKIKGTTEEIVVATTRIETMLGDVAVAVHPDDVRYKKFVGMELEHPFFKDRKMTLIADPILVDMSFGTGAVKVTPAHDQSDYECGVRNKLPNIIILNNDGTINKNGGQFEGLNRFACRDKIYKELDTMKLIRGKTPNPMVLSLCQRSGDVLEPMIKPQWWMNCKELAAKSVEAVEKKELTIIPESFNNVWYQWLKNIKEWCVSRQLWWGHRIPAYLCRVAGIVENPDPSISDSWIVARNEIDAMEMAMKKYNVPKEKITLSQDEDVLDTWFSSGLLPMTSLGWPEQVDDFKNLFPTDILETGSDIIFFWVARMVMMSLALTGKLPFKTVLLHQLVMDREGRKMSKSKGNVVDPVEIIEGCPLDMLLKKLETSNLQKDEIEKGKTLMKKDFVNGIPECGVDALRFGLMSYLMQGRSINLDILRVIGYRHFCNKLWNATKFTLGHLGTSFKYLPEDQWATSFIDSWIMHRLNVTTKEANEAISQYNFGDAATALYNFWLYDFCDVYLEAVKPIVYAKEESKEKETAKNVLYKCLSDGLKLLHPIMPFITEELYHRLPVTPLTVDSICIAKYPTYNKAYDNPACEKGMNLVMDIVKSLRSSMTALNIPKKEKPNVFMFLKKPEDLPIVEKNASIIISLARVGKCVVSDKPVTAGCVRKVVSLDCDAYLEVKGLIDAKAEVL